MFGTIGLPEILFILVLALLVFGPKRLPEVGRTIGRALGEFRRSTGDLKRSFDREMSAVENDARLDLADDQDKAESSDETPSAGSAGSEGSEGAG